MSLSRRDPLLLLVNPSSGGGRGLHAAAAARLALTSAGVATELAVTGSAEALAERAAAAARAGVAAVAVAGGDGTVQLAARALAGTATALGLIPAGRGNDLARALGIPLRAADAGRLLATAAPRPVDLAVCGGRRFVTVATLGLDTMAAAMVHRREVPGSGTLAYVLAALIAVKRYRPVAVSLEGDFGRIEVRAVVVATANTRSYGGGMRIAPDARPDDGLLDVCIVPEMGRLRVLGLLPRVFWGGHARNKAVTLVRTRRLVIRSERPMPIYADGEPLAEAPATIEVEPRALRVLAPPPAA